MHRSGRVGPPGQPHGRGADRGMYSPELCCTGLPMHITGIPVSLWVYVTVGVQSGGNPPPPRPKICSVVIPKQMSKTQALPQDVEFSKIRKLRGKKKAQEQQPCLQAGIPCGASLRWDQGTLRQTGPVLTAAKGGTCKRGKSKTYVLVCQKRARRPAPFRDRPAERQSTDVSLSQGCEPAPAR